MKKTFIKVALFCLIGSVVFVSCNSTKNSTSADGYDSDGTTAEAPGTSNNKKSDGKSFLDVFKSDKFEIVDNCNIHTETTFGGLKNQDAVVTVFPKTSMAGFGSPYLLAYYYLSFDDLGRKKFRDSVDKYLADFENKALDRKGSKTHKAYGSSKVRLDWGTIQSTVPNWGIGTANFGYKFKDNSPYFTITIYSVHNEKFDPSLNSYPEESLQLNYYMTKAQASALAAFMKDDYVNSKLAENTKIQTVEKIADEY